MPRDTDVPPAALRRDERPPLPAWIDPRHAGATGRARLARWIDAITPAVLAPAKARDRLAAADAATGDGSAAAAEALAHLARHGVRAVPFGSPLYPERLAALADAPACLFVRGEIAAFAARAVAIVGSRAPTPYGVAVAERLAADLARAGVLVISGLARGIDAAAHRGALAAGGRTVAVQGCGPDRVYPAAHRALAEAIAGAGAVVSELPPGTAPLPLHFPLRNRVISALAEAIVVVEARERSGTLSTVGHALEQGRDVFAVPGPIDRPTSVGPNRLLRDGAFVLLEARDLLDRLGLAPGPAAAACAPDATLGPLAEHALAVVRAGPIDRNALARRLGAPGDALALALLELELAGRVALDRDGRLVPRGSP